MGCIPSSIDSDLPKTSSKYPVLGADDIMKRKSYGTSAVPIQTNLRWNLDVEEADRICNYNRHYAERSGAYEFSQFDYKNQWRVRSHNPVSLANAGAFEKNKGFKQEMTRARKKGERVKFYDSNTGELLFVAPVGRSHRDFWIESSLHGWPSFRDSEVNWEIVRCLRNGESVSLGGTHLVSSDQFRIIFLRAVASILTINSWFSITGAQFTRSNWK